MMYDCFNISNYIIKMPSGKKRIGVILENTQVPEELKIMGTGKFRPNINWGKSSKRNTIGEYKTNKDLPKIDKYINTIEWHWKQYNGRDLDDMYDFFDIYRKVYQKEFIQPLEVEFVFIEERNVIYLKIIIMIQIKIFTQKILMNIYQKMALRIAIGKYCHQEKRYGMFQEQKNITDQMEKKTEKEQLLNLIELLKFWKKILKKNIKE